ncbi:MAG: carboxylating nicotinate-nucleotide diphosphorylase [candidate division Zixibacteria bacterium]|nr:carboxylating nicotinate-nucleotide diphosphorylase [Candidatus Tariuqbacter arcticus]
MEVYPIIETAVHEDLGFAGDLTSRACISEEHRSCTKVISRCEGVIAGMDYFVQVFQKVDSSTEIQVFKEDGASVTVNDAIVTMEGYTQSLLAGERTALNFLGHLSGIATMTSRLVKEVDDTGVILLDTRKTLPGLRAAEKKAVRAGGGYNHRFGLFDMILIKENHIAAAGGIIEALKRAHQYNKRVGGRLEIEIEVRNLDELQAAIGEKPDRIMLDNFTVEMVRQAVQYVNGKIALEVSGGVNENNIREYAEAGPDYISVGTITSSAPALDLSMLVEGIGK